MEALGEGGFFLGNRNDLMLSNRDPIAVPPTGHTLSLLGSAHDLSLFFPIHPFCLRVAVLSLGSFPTLAAALPAWSSHGTSLVRPYVLAVVCFSVRLLDWQLAEDRGVTQHKVQRTPSVISVNSFSPRDSPAHYQHFCSKEVQEKGKAAAMC